METGLLRKYDKAAQHNLLVRAPLKLTGTEARILTLALAHVRKGDTELPSIRIRFQDVFPGSNGSQSDYEALDKATTGIMSKVVQLRSVNGKSKVTEKYNIISYIKLDSGTSLITGSFDERIAPYLLDLVGHFTTMAVQTLLTVKSPHTYRAMWVLKSYAQASTVTEKEFDLDEFRQMLLGDNHKQHYPEYFDFKRFLLTPVMEEITDPTGINWDIQCEEIKAGMRRIIGLRFTIPPLEEVGAKQLKVARGAKVKGASGEAFVEFLATLPANRVFTYGKLVEDGIDKMMAQRILYLIGTNDAALKKVAAARTAATNAKRDGKMSCDRPAFIMTEIQKSFPELISKRN